MGANTKISWADDTFNPWIGCTKVSPGCAHCYAEALMDKRWGKVEWGPGGQRLRTSPGNWNQVRRWNREAAEAGTRRRVFCASLADVFEERPELEPWREDLWALIGETQSLDWLLLTKRIEFARDWLESHYDAQYTIGQAGRWPSRRVPRSNVWLGASVEDMQRLDERLPRLLEAAAAVKFLSIEPLLGPIDLSIWFRREQQPDWVIVGGESGRAARDCRIGWITRIVDCCKHYDVPVFVKQLGSVLAKRLGLLNTAGENIEQWPPDYQPVKVRQLPLVSRQSSAGSRQKAEG